MTQKFSRQLRFNKQVNVGNRAQGDVLNRTTNNMRKHFFFSEKLNEKDNHPKDVKKTRNQFVKEYLKYHHKHFWSKRPKVRCQPKAILLPSIGPKIRCQPNETIVPNIGPTVRIQPNEVIMSGLSPLRNIPNIVESRQQLEQLRFLDDTNIDKDRSENHQQKHRRSKSTIR
jgi:hypothetical protein